MLTACNCQLYNPSRHVQKYSACAKQSIKKTAREVKHLLNVGSLCFEFILVGNLYSVFSEILGKSKVGKYFLQSFRLQDCNLSFLISLNLSKVTFGNF